MELSDHHTNESSGFQLAISFFAVFILRDRNQGAFRHCLTFSTPNSLGA